MLRSAVPAIVRAALSETFEVSAARISSAGRDLAHGSARAPSAEPTATERCCEQRAAGRGEVVDEPCLLHAAGRARSCPVAAGKRGLVVVPVHGRGRAAVQERASRCGAGCRPCSAGSAGRPWRTSRTAFTYRSASVRWRAATSTTAALWREPDVERIERLTLSAEKSAKTTRIAAIGLRLRAANGLSAAALPKREPGSSLPHDQCRPHAGHEVPGHVAEEDVAAGPKMQLSGAHSCPARPARARGR